MPRFVCDHVLLPTGWRSPGVLEVDDRGEIVATDGPTEAATRVRGYVLPSVANLHSHAFQRALAGQAEHRSPEHGEDSFWTWREAMYSLALRLTPEELEAIAAQLYVEMLEAGITAVGEFHYLHHAPDGVRYADLAEMSGRVMQAAEQTGLAITMLPVLYMTGGFDAPATDRQRRFTVASVDEGLRLFEAVRAHAAESPTTRVGLAPHSLRAVPADALREAVAGVHRIESKAPLHIHIAEQVQEVQDCLARRGARPVEWLLDHADVDPRWCLVHATHLEGSERTRLAHSGAIAGLCPTTEANLGDGIFDAQRYLEAGGRFGVGSDSQVAISVSEELRLLEYGQRLLHRRRNLLASPEAPHVGRFLYEAAARGGAQALDQRIGRLEPGYRADLVVLDPEHPRLVGHGPETALDAFVFGGAGGAIREVYVAGRRVIVDGQHPDRERIRTRFSKAMARLQA